MTMDTVNWVVAGIGDIARKRVIPAIQAEPRSRLYGFVTRTPAKAATYPGARSWASLEDAVADSAVDAVYVALPVAFHAGAAIAALRAGKHVLCEKPMAMNFAEAERMVARRPRCESCFGPPVRCLVLPPALPQADPRQTADRRRRHRPAPAGRGQLP
jgi:predicted dehydrogenase